MNNQSLFYESGKRAVLLFHAFTSTPRDVISLARALERANYTVYAPVFSGHGTSDLDDLFNYSIKDWIKDGEDAVAFLNEKGYDEIAVFGLSLGGVVATHLLLNEEATIGGGTFSAPVTTTYDNHVTDSFLAWYKTVKRTKGYERDELAGLMTKAEIELKEMFDELKAFVSNMEKQYPTLDKKIFIGQGEKDELIEPDTARIFRESLDQAEVSIKLYENGEHVITTGSVGKKLQTHVLTFLSTLNWDGGDN
ncbi:alpha/beta hydrolase [Alkalibacterium kapii]|uniref:Carboxylesterase n=1 Tax=Alkalibacterium kapii TaxID=426704 RepID=A0A511AUI2_9LACT|nr:alpha/beta fold hydrolase [Alkalibacterium kapii]GEK91794.1 carboxylesterase [Alkalibacterium kapii]